MSFRLFSDTVPRSVSRPLSRSLSGSFDKAIVDNFQPGQDDSLSNSGTPSLITDPSRSASSSVFNCEGCENTSQQCSCTDDNYPERLRLYYRVPSEYKTTRNVSPAESIRYKQSCPGVQHLSNYVAADSSTPPPGKGHEYPTPDATDSQGAGSEYGGHLDHVVSTTATNTHDEQKNFTESVSKDVILPGYVESELERSDEDGNEIDQDEDDIEDSKDDWSGQDDNIEAIVMEELGSDLALAAHLIPILHGMFYSEMQASVKQKVGPWRNGIVSCTMGGGSANPPTSRDNWSQSTANPRKRQRSSNQEDQEGEEEEDDDEENGDSKDFGTPSGIRTASQNPNLACPFYKLDPIKYSTQHNTAETANNTKYRTCQGPGFNSIQRLKEHLRRKHYPVQCERCYKIFPGVDRAACVLELQSHRQLPTPCPRGVESLKEGISDAQWASLERRNSRRPQSISRVEKYWQIWDTIFPGMEKPDTPWYDNKTAKRQHSQFSQETQTFSGLFAPMLEMRNNQQQIVFPEGLDEEMRHRIVLLAEQAFALCARMHWPSLSSNSSSSRSLQHSSHFGGSSYEMVPSPRTLFGRHSSSGSQSTLAQSNGHSMDPQGSMSRRTSMPPPPPVLPQMVQQGFVTNASSIPMHSHPPAASAYPVAFPGNAYNDNNLAPAGAIWYDSYGNTTNGFSSSSSAVQLNSAAYPTDPGMTGADAGSQDLTVLPDWQELANATNPGQMRFNDRHL